MGMESHSNGGSVKSIFVCSERAAAVNAWRTWFLRRGHRRTGIFM